MRSISRIKKLLFLLLFLLLSPFRKKIQICFIVHSGDSWSGNFKVLYDDLYKAGCLVKVIDKSGRIDTLKSLRQHEVDFARSYFSTKYLLSSVIFSSHGPEPVSLILNSMPSIKSLLGDTKRLRALLWHGVGVKSHSNNWVNFSDKYFDVAFANDDYDRERLIKRFNLPSDKVVVSGYPRLKLVYGPEISLSSEDNKELAEIKKIKGSKRMALYAPTWDVFLEDDSLLFSNIEVLLNLLEEKPCYFLGVRLHPKSSKILNLRKEEFQKVRSRAYFFLPEDFSTTELLIRESDCLITDYSSIWYDYHYSGKPIFIDKKSVDKAIEIGRVSTSFGKVFKSATGKAVKGFCEISNELNCTKALEVENEKRDFNSSKFIMEYLVREGFLESCPRSSHSHLQP